jgi:segregation and condensation protein A
VSSFRVDLDAYNGPLDLLLFLIRRDEVDIYDIPIAAITEQYVGYVRVIEALDPNLAGDFLVMAATLMEIKSRTLLPRPPLEEGDEEFIDPRVELVRQLLEYKAFKDAARTLGTAGEWQALKSPRHPVLPQADADDLDLEEVGIWDLLEAFNRLLEQTGRRATAHEVVYDDTPLALHATDIVDSLERTDGSQRFEHIFAGRTKAELIGMFLALLELIRQRRVRAEQERPFGPIVLHLLDASPIESGEFDRQYAGAPPSPPDPPVVPAPSARSEPEDSLDQTVQSPGRNGPDQPDTETEHHAPQ